MNSITPKYDSGETIQPGDKIKYSGEDGVVDFVVTESFLDWETYWKDLGPGVMLSVPSFGSVYVPFDDEDLELISRGNDFNK